MARRPAGLLATAGLALVVILLVTHRAPTHSPAKSITAVAPTSATRLNHPYNVIGNHILNSRGQVVVVHGVNRSSLENSCTGATVTGRQTGIPASDFATMHKAWDATVVRLPLDQEFWLTDCRGYRATVRRAVKEIEAEHMIVILDLHWWTDPADLSFATGEQAICMPNSNSITFWRQVASTYKAFRNVWFELYNEPDPVGTASPAQWNLWRNGGLVNCENVTTRTITATYQAVGMQQLVNTIRATGAMNIILADGIDKAYTLEGVSLLAGSNVAYAIHPYISFSSNTESAWSDSDWDARFGNLARRVPVVATEFGDFECADSAYARAYEEAILSYFHAHQLSYLAWDWYAAYGCDVPELINSAAGVCRKSMGCLIQQAIKSFAPKREQQQASASTR